MKKKLSLFFIVAFFATVNTNAQYSFIKGNNTLELSGSLVGYYNYRFYPTSTTDLHNNKFGLDYAELKFKGEYEKNIRYSIRFNLADLLITDSTRSAINLGTNFLHEATVEYYGLRKYVLIKVGYDKIPFSRSSLTEYHDSPFLQRGEIARGELFGRRDMGVTLRQEFLNRRINVYAGAYTGLGEGSLGGDNDASGKLEYVGRIDYSWHARYRYNEYDLEGMPIPVAAIGANILYEEKKSNAGKNYDIQTIDGKKTGYGFDADFKFKGFAAHFEALQFKLVPNDVSRLNGYPTDYFKVGGVMASVNYFIKPIHSVIAVRYDELNPNDLTYHDTEKTLSFAYNYMFNKTTSCIKIQYWYRLKDDGAAQAWTDNQLRIGYQFLF